MANNEKSKTQTKKATTKKVTPKKQTTTKKEEKSKNAVKTSNTSSVTKVSKKNSKKEPKIVQEENNYTRTIIAAVLIAFIFLGGYLAIQFKTNGGLGDNKEYVPTTEEKNFKKDYESLNGTTSVDGVKFSETSIIKDNNIKYISMDEALDILDSGSGVIYFGYASCPYSRSAVPVLLDAMTSSELDTIYYVNLRPKEAGRLDGVGQKENDLRDTYTLNAKNKAKRTKEAASESYYEILTSLANYLDDYILITEKGKKVSTGEKRLDSPTVVAIVNGEVVGFHSKTVASQTANDQGELPELTKDEEKELLSEYTKLISAYLKNK